jgi:hypothetical protein
VSPTAVGFCRLIDAPWSWVGVRILIQETVRYMDYLMPQFLTSKSSDQFTIVNYARDVTIDHHPAAIPMTLHTIMTST